MELKDVVIHNEVVAEIVKGSLVIYTPHVKLILFVGEHTGLGFDASKAELNLNDNAPCLYFTGKPSTSLR